LWETFHHHQVKSLFTEWNVQLSWVTIWCSMNCEWKQMIFLFIRMMSLFFSHWSCSFSLRMNVSTMLLNKLSTLTFLLSFKSSIMIMTFINVFSISKSLLIRSKLLKRFWRYCMINIWDLFSSIFHSARVINVTSVSRLIRLNKIEALINSQCMLASTLHND